MSSGSEAEQLPRVLLVDDHAVLVHALALILQREGMDVEVAADYSLEGVVAAAERFRPDLAVLDLYLGPNETCIPFIKPLTTRGTCVLVLTASERPEELAACLTEGAAAVLPKRDALSASVGAIRAVLAGEDVRIRESAELLTAGRQAQRDHQRLLEPFERLTRREQEVLAAIMEGKSAQQIADEDMSSIRTVRSHLQAIRMKLGVRSQVAAVALAREAGWTGPSNP